MNRGVATLIGDVVASRSHANRRRLQVLINEALDETNDRVTPIQPLEPTVGDEFQGTYSTVGSAALASLLVRLRLLSESQRGATDSRFGLGFGEVTVFDRARSPIPQDGPGWWSARSAIDQCRFLSNEPRTSYVRTCFGHWTGELFDDPAESEAINAFLLCRDSIVDRMTPRQRRLLRGVLLGLPQGVLARIEGITQGAVSQSLRRSGAFAIEDAHRRLVAITQ